MAKKESWWAEVEFFGKNYHWTRNRKGVLILHQSTDRKCHRVHYNQDGHKIP